VVTPLTGGMNKGKLKQLPELLVSQLQLQSVATPTCAMTCKEQC